MLNIEFARMFLALDTKLVNKKRGGLDKALNPYFSPLIGEASNPSPSLFDPAALNYGTLSLRLARLFLNLTLPSRVVSLTIGWSGEHHQIPEFLR